MRHDDVREPATRAAWSPMNSIDCDVVVIGAGATGLVAADELIRAGASVVVVEARSRVGGRLWTTATEHGPIEMGGQWISPDQDAVLELIDRLDLTTFARHREGRNIYITRDGQRREFEGEVLPTSAHTESEVARLTRILDALTAQVDPESPWLLPDAGHLDQITFRAWLETQTDDVEAQDNIAMFVAGAMLTKPAHSFSLLEALRLTSSAGSFSNLVDADIVLDRRVVGGLEQLPARLADQLGDIVHLNEPVQVIEQTDDLVTVVARTVTARARGAILAIPPHLVNGIAFEPPLTADRQQLSQHISMGDVLKVQAVYPQPFWRDHGLSGTAFSPYQTVHEAYDNTSHGDTRGILVGFVSDEQAQRLGTLTPDDRRNAVLRSFADYFGAEAENAIGYYESSWTSDPWTRGAYGTSFDVGGLSRFGDQLGRAEGRLQFASSDTAGVGFLHVDGAVRRGQQAATAFLTSNDLSGPR